MFLAASGDRRELGEPGECEVAFAKYILGLGGDAPMRSGSVCPLSSLLRLTCILFATDGLSSLLADGCCAMCKDSPGDPLPLGCGDSASTSPRPLVAWSLIGLFLDV